MILWYILVSNTILLRYDIVQCYIIVAYTISCSHNMMFVLCYDNIYCITVYYNVFYYSML